MGDSRSNKCAGVGCVLFVQFQPANGVLDFGHVLATDRHQQVLKVSNQSSFPCEVELCRGRGETSTPLSFPTFIFHPERATLPPSSSLAIVCTFAPVHARLRPYREDIQEIGRASCRERVL